MHCFTIAKGVSLLLALGSCVTGLIAARRWYEASTAPTYPAYGLPGSGRIEPVEREQALGDWIVELDKAANESGRLNKIAAWWTALAAGLAGLSSLVGALADCFK